MLRILSRGDLLYDFLMTSVQAKMRDVRIDDIERFLCVCVAFPFCMKEYTYIFDRPLVAIQALDLLWLREEGEGESECIYLMDKCLRGQTGRDRAGEVATQDGVETWVHVPIVFFSLGAYACTCVWRLVETNAVPTPTVLVLVAPYITLMDR